MVSSRRKILGVSRMDSSSQLGLHHDLILPSDDGVQESLGDVEGLLSNRHKQLLIKFLAKKESSRVVAEEDSDNMVPSNSHLLKKLQSERLKKGEHQHEVRRGSDSQQPACNNNNKVVGGQHHHLSLSPKPSLISMMHSKVLRLTSTASAVSGDPPQHPHPPPPPLPSHQHGLRCLWVQRRLPGRRERRRVDRFRGRISTRRPRIRFHLVQRVLAVPQGWRTHSPGDVHWAQCFSPNPESLP